MGSTFFFCGTKCKTKFDVNPMLYMSGNAEKSQMTSAAAGTIYTCPMHPEIRQDHAGNCPKCGMTLEPLLPELEEDENPELRDFQRRFWWTLATG
jgi:Cu+-exporting ATPase